MGAALLPLDATTTRSRSVSNDQISGLLSMDATKGYYDPDMVSGFRTVNGIPCNVFISEDGKSTFLLLPDNRGFFCRALLQFVNVAIFLFQLLYSKFVKSSGGLDIK